MRRGALELSLNALVMFIVSIIVLGFGIWLVGSFLDIGSSVISAPDRCDAQLDRAVRGGELYSLCPAMIPGPVWNPSDTYEISYIVTNTLADERSYGVAITDPASDFEVLSGNVYDLSSYDVRRGIFSIRLKEDAVAPSGPAYVRIEFCTLAGDVPDCSSGNIGSQVLSINTPS